MKILAIHGPNLNFLGKRDPVKYGFITLMEINLMLISIGKKEKVDIVTFQSNHEGSIIDFLQRKTSREADGVLINPGALTRYGYSLRQALIDFAKPVIEVHMSDIKTGINKSVNILDDVRIKQICGLKEESYYHGLIDLINYIQKKNYET